MQKVYILGDSHALRLGHILFDNIINRLNKDQNYFTQHTVESLRTERQDQDGEHLFLRSELHTISVDDKSMSTAAFLGRSALNFDYSMYGYTSDWNKSSNTIMPWFGYIDIKNYLPIKTLDNFKNPKQVVETYVNNVLKNFKNSNIIFIKPIPQFEVMVSARWKTFSADPGLEFEVRHSAHIEFCERLEQKCKRHGLQSPIDISDILGVPWIYSSMQYKKPIQYIYNDHCLPEYYNKILDDFIDNKKIISFGP